MSKNEIKSTEMLNLNSATDYYFYIDDENKLKYEQIMWIHDNKEVILMYINLQKVAFNYFANFLKKLGEQQVSTVYEEEIDLTNLAIDLRNNILNYIHIHNIKDNLDFDNINYINNIIINIIKTFKINLQKEEIYCQNILDAIRINNYFNNDIYGNYSIEVRENIIFVQFEYDIYCCTKLDSGIYQPSELTSEKRIIRFDIRKSRKPK